MAVFKMESDNLPIVANFMQAIKPDWWDYDGALGQLSNINESIESIGWYVGDDKNHPKGWAFFRELKGYRSIELECCGYDDNGTFALEHKLEELFNVACTYAKAKGYLTFRTAMGSTQFSIHDRPLGDIGEEIHNLKSYNRIDFDWLLSYGFKVIGIQPHALGKNYHCILLTKDLTD